MDASEGCSWLRPERRHARGRLYSDAACVGLSLLPTAYDKRKRPRGVGTSFATGVRWNDVQLLPRSVGDGLVRTAVNEAVHSPKPRTYCGALASIQRAKAMKAPLSQDSHLAALSHRDSLRSQRARIRQARNMPQGMFHVQPLPRPVGAGPVRAAANEAVHSPKPRSYPRRLQAAQIREAQRMPQGILCVHAHPQTPTHPQALQKSQPSLRITV